MTACFYFIEEIKLINLMQGDCLERMKEIESGSVDLTVTSPPYDSLRSYNGNNKHWCEDIWKSIIFELYRVTKSGGIVVWIVGDSTVGGSETGTSLSKRSTQSLVVSNSTTQ